MSRSKEDTRQRAAIYSEALRELRDRHREEFEEIWTSKMGHPRLKPRKEDRQLPIFGTNAAKIVEFLLTHDMALTERQIGFSLKLPPSSVAVARAKLVEGAWIEKTGEMIGKAFLWRPTQKAFDYFDAE